MSNDTKSKNVPTASQQEAKPTTGAGHATIQVVPGSGIKVDTSSTSVVGWKGAA